MAILDSRHFGLKGDTRLLEGAQVQGGGFMDLVVVPGIYQRGFATGGPLVETGGYWVHFCLFSLCLCVWVFGFCYTIRWGAGRPSPVGL